MITDVKCPDCGSHDFFHNRGKGELICRQCSIVLDESMVDFGRDSRFFEDDGDGEHNSRTGAPFDPLVVDNLGTSIGNAADLSKLSGRNRALFQRIKKRQHWTATSFEQNLKTAFNNLKLMSGGLNLPSSVEKEAAVIYRRCVERGLTKRSAIEHLVIASLFLASKLQGFPRAMKEFANIAKVDMTILGKNYKLIMREIGIRINPTNPLDYVTKFATALKLSPKVQTKSVKYIEQMEKMGLTSGLSPLSVAASTLYIAAQLEKEKRTQREFAEISGVTETTLRNRCKDLVKALKVKVK
jgi:transcription initiation factor TFIIB